MKKLFSLFICFVTCTSAFAQVQFSLQNFSGRAEIRATIQPGWQLYMEEFAVHTNDSVLMMQGLRNAVTVNDVLFGEDKKIFKDSVSFFVVLPAHATEISIAGFAGSNTEYLGIDTTIYVASVASANTLQIPGLDLSKPTSDCGETASVTEDRSLLQLFLLGLAGGLLALLTPCVFPMIPVTVSFFTQRSSSKKEGVRNGLLYGFFIFTIYIIASIPFHLIHGADPQILNTISTSASLNIAFFVIFVAFALSFFGLFEIQLPSGIANIAGNKGSLASAGGIFFMALTLAIVSFSCTGPILGTLLVSAISSGGAAWQLTAGMAGFGVALAAPFALFAIFPNRLASLPKSGAWMSTIKKILAFAELALALKFLSNADLVSHWGILPREVFIGLWALIALAMTVYLITKKYFVIGALSLVLTIYLCTGLFGASLSMLSGFPPPSSYSIHRDPKNKGVHPNVMNDYDSALALAKQTGKPLLIDFTGWACVNCRKTEEHIWTIPAIKTLIESKFILVSLYVDDRKMLPASKQFVLSDSTGQKQSIKTVGNKWAQFQAINFKQVTQPLYVIMNSDQQLLTRPIGYTPDGNAYKEWLECGVHAFAEKK